MKLMIVGLGSIGMRHARNFKELGANVMVGLDPSAERRSQFIAEIGGRAVSTIEDGFAQAPEMAVIASPTRFHVEHAMRCAEMGCHLLIEKPLGASLEGVPALLAAVEQRCLFAHVSSNFKFHRASPIIRELLYEGAIGKVTAAQVLAGEWLPGRHPWEDYRQGYAARQDLGGGIVLDTHEFDYLTWLLGPVQLAHGFATRSGCLDVSTDDVACACLYFASGVLATLQIDYIQREYRRRYHISGDAGTIEWDFATGSLSIYRACSQKKQLIDVGEDNNEMYVRQARQVLEAATSGGNPVTSIADAAGVLDLQLTIRDCHV